MNGDVLRVASEVEVSGAVADWVEQVGRFLGVVQAALEQSRPREDASAEVRALAPQLPALIRQCRAQVPTPEMIRTWVQTLAEDRPAGSGDSSPARHVTPHLMATPAPASTPSGRLSAASPA